MWCGGRPNSLPRRRSKAQVCREDDAEQQRAPEIPVPQLTQRVALPTLCRYQHIAQLDANFFQEHGGGRLRSVSLKSVWCPTIEENILLLRSRLTVCQTGSFRVMMSSGASDIWLSIVPRSAPAMAAASSSEEAIVWRWEEFMLLGVAR